MCVNYIHSGVLSILWVVTELWDMDGRTVRFVVMTQRIRNLKIIIYRHDNNTPFHIRGRMCFITLVRLSIVSLWSGFRCISEHHIRYKMSRTYRKSQKLYELPIKQPPSVLFGCHSFLDLPSILRIRKHTGHAKGFVKGSRQFHSSSECWNPIKVLFETSRSVVFKSRISFSQPDHAILDHWTSTRGTPGTAVILETEPIRHYNLNVS